MTDQTVSRRALRRHQAARRKRWVSKTLGHYFLPGLEPEPRRIGLYARTPTPCSCPLCGNPRRWLQEPTIQERRAADRFADGIALALAETHAL